jgi:hypothetical protein
MNLGAFRTTALLIVALVSAALSPVAAGTTVGVYGFEYPQNAGDAINTLSANGYTAASVTLTDIAAGLAGYDVLYVTHPFDGGGWSSAACSGLRKFLAAGKGVVLEWDASLLIFTSLGPNIYVNATPQCAMFAGVADRGQSVGFNTPVKITDAASPLTTALISPFAMGAASDYMYQITGFDTSIWKVSATYAGWGGQNNVSLAYGRYQSAGCVALGTMAFADNGYADVLDSSSRILFLNMIATVKPGQNNCRGALVPLSWAIPASSPLALLLLAAIICGSALLLYRRFPGRNT